MPKFARSVGCATVRKSASADAAPGFILTISTSLEDAKDVAPAIDDITAFLVERELSPQSSLMKEQNVSGAVCVSLDFGNSCFALTNPNHRDLLCQELKQRINAASLRIRCDVVPVEPRAGQQQPPRFWKRWVVSMLGVYPLLIVIFYALRPMTQSLSVPIALFVVALVLTGLNGRYVAPFLTRKLQSWVAR